MNILKKIYCRIFQTCFRIALPVLPYRTGTDRRIQTRPGSPEKTSHFPYPARHRSGGLQTRAYKTFGKTAFKI